MNKKLDRHKSQSETEVAKKRDDSAKAKPETKKTSKPKAQGKPASKVEKAASTEKKSVPPRKPRSVKPVRLQTNEHPLVGAVFAAEEISLEAAAVKELAVENVSTGTTAMDEVEARGLEQKIVKSKKGSEAVRPSSLTGLSITGPSIPQPSIPQLSEQASGAVLSNDAIANRAWQIWLKEGCPEGRALEHWLQAESELRDI